MKTENKKLTLREEIGLITRAVGIWNKIMPKFWLYQVMSIIVSTFTPYFTLYMSSLMINELAGECELRRLIILAAITVGGTFLISVMVRFLDSRKGLRDFMMWNMHEGYMVDAQNNMQYEHLENHDVVLMRSRIFAVLNATGSGLPKVLWSVPSLLSSILNIVFSVAITASMFVTVADGNFRGVLAFINSPYSVLFIVALIAVNAAINIKLANDSTVKTNEIVSEYLAEGNMRYDVLNKLWGADMVAFDLFRIVKKELEEILLRPKWLEFQRKLGMKYGFITVIVNAVLNISIFLFTAAKAFIGTFGIGNFVLYQGTVSRFVGAVTSFAAAFGNLRQNNQYLMDLYEYLDLPNDMYKGSLAVEKRDDIDYEIEFRDVSFKYPRTDTWVLRHVNIKFKIGDKLAIVGENGSGKTTFIKLLCRLYDPTEGKILLNGIDVTRYRYDEYMALFSVVFQDYTIFGFSIAENVAASNVYDKERVCQALIRAELSEKLEELNGNVDVCIGRDYDNEGVDLSGGEKQKIALARALYKDAPFVVLDEPTAALDPIAEAAVYENFNKIVEDKTSVFISHRLSSCRFCNTIAVFDKGELVQTGSHDELVSEDSGKYSQLWKAQAKYYESKNETVSL